MANFARVIGNVAVDVSADPTIQFHPDLVAEFVPVPDDVVNGWVLTDGQWAAPAPPPEVEPDTTVTYPSLSPMEFYLAFKPAERIALKTSKDPIVKEFWTTYELAVQAGAKIDMALKSNQDAINYLSHPTASGPAIIAPERVPEILQGQAQ